MSDPRRELERDFERDPFGEGAAAARSRKLRSWGLALALVAFCGLIFVVTVLKISANAHHG